MEAPPPPDPRVEFLGNCVQKTMKLKPEKWSRLMGLEDYKNIVMDFLDTDKTNLLVITQNNAAQLIPSTSFPVLLKNKGAYFVKKNKGPVPKTDISFNIIYGDLATKPIEQLATLVDEIFVPLLSNKNNHRKWPKSVAQDISQHVHSLKSTVYQVRGFVAGKTVLPMPIGIDRVHDVVRNMSEGNDAVDLYLKSSIEGVVIKWAIQINDVLLEESSKAFATGQNPVPNSEISFWNGRKENLQYIYDQMREDRVRKMALILEHSESAYWPCFKNIFFNVVSALTEANEIAVFLKPLEVHFSLIVETDFSDVLPCFIPLMHTVCLVWSKCKYYCTSGRIIVLLKQISNLVIEQAKKYLDPNSIFQTDIDEALMRVQLSLFILKNFRKTFDNYKEKLGTFFPEGTTPQLWTFHPNVVFERFNSFTERLQTIELFFLTVVEFIKLERVEIGNVKGSIFSSQLIDISQQFTTYFTEFSSKSYDVMNPDDNTFMDDYYAFQANISDLDKRLASILCLAFDDCCNLEGVFKLLEIIGTFLERPLIKQEFNCKFDKIIVMVEKETRIVEQIFNEQMNKHKKRGTIDVELCMPPVAGALRWIDTLRERLNYCITKFRALDHPTAKGSRANDLYRKYDSLVNKFNTFQENEFAKWAEKVDETVKTHLNENIIKRNLPKTMLSVNFHKQLEAILKEVHYFQLDDKDGIPQAGLDIYAKREEYREYTVQLEIIIKWYNKMRRDSRLVEFELVQERIEEIDKLIGEAESSLTWLSTELTEYIGKLHELVRKVQEPLSSTQTNVSIMKTLMDKWLKSPLYMRTDKEGLLAIEDKEEKIQKRYSEMSEVGIEIHNLLVLNKTLFHMEGKENTECWKMYINYIDDIVRSALLSTIGCSLAYLTENMDKDTTQHPLLGVKLTLSDSELALKCEPPLDTAEPGCFTVIVEGIIKDIMHMSTLIKRVKGEADTDYKSDIDTEEDVVEMIQEIVQHVNTTVEEVMENCTGFEMYSNIWLDDRQSYMQSFLAYGRQLTMEELELNMIPEENTPPTMDQFKQQIDSFEVLYSEIEELKSIEVFDKWFQLDISPFKMSLLNAVSKWAMMFKEYLLEHVTNSLWELSQFIQDADEGLNQPVQEGDYTALVSVMGYLLKVKERQPETDEMFCPLQETIELLKTYEMELPQDANVLLQELPEQWNNTKKLASNIKQAVSPLQAAEVVSIRRKITWFDMRQAKMREHFKKAEFLRYDCEYPYEIINDSHFHLAEFEEEMHQLQQSASLFELNIPEFKLLKQCRRELKMLKQLWDYVYIVQTSIEDWKTTPWREVDVENMDIECKKFAKDIRALDKEMKNWDTYTTLEATVKNMLTSLRAVGELQNPAIRERHWHQLIKSTKTIVALPPQFTVEFVMDTNTTLADLLALNLHECEDEVKNIVDKAVKEMSMEKMLRDLGVTWTAMELEQEPHARTGCVLLRASEQLIETLEENQVQLQNLITSKFIAHFLEEVSSWQQKLSLADQVITVWFEVQRTWTHLESIFMSSEDIKKQLPEDSERFYRIDKQFKGLLEDMAKIPNVVQATNRPDLLGELEKLQVELILCEKALAQYLETKRLKFPRFYFVSSADLLDVLSNGNHPRMVVRHMIKLFDSLANLRFILEETGEPKSSLGMCAKDGEYVEFKGNCDCTGAIHGVWNQEKTAYFDTHVVNADASSYGSQPWSAISQNAANDKHHKYDTAAEDLRGSFTPLVVSCDGALHREYDIFLKRMAEVLSEKWAKPLSQVEVWLNRVQRAMKDSIRHYFAEAVTSYEEKPRDQWLFDYPAQVSLCATQIWWTTELNMAFARLEEGYDNAMRDYHKKQISQLSTLISLLLGELTKQDRQKIMTICTIDVHSRDVVAKLIQAKVDTSAAFQWQSQLRHRWDDKEGDCFANICDAQFRYCHEYLGNTPRLVITPLTDRCYITLTQSLHLVMGGGPAGPAGTGKTETTKDLGRALGMMVYVFNCSEQMDYKSCGNIYKGLAQTGAWGCFDEFNRISVEVLSVVAVQVKSLQDAIREKKSMFNFMGEIIAMDPTVGIFITMNPGYAGRTELPENLKALFRPCAMVVPDFELICEIMLVAEGFQEAKILARKFITLYTLCKELLSKQDHYDWGLRAIKSVLVVAGSLKRGDPGRPEEEVLMRALRDFNTPKIVTDDVPVFMGLIGDLFPALDVPRKRNAEFEHTVKQAAMDLLLQPEDSFILKVVQLEELLEVRHSVFVVGNAGTSKTQVWRTLFKTYQNMKKKPMYNDLNPKAVINDELFGIINPATREWKDGLFSCIMREQANLNTENPKWIVLDGDIDPMWIESLNTVMDDNKVLTLASNERIALTHSMRLLFEISNLRTATPATVSRAGILYINPQDLGWNPYVTSWIETRESNSEKATLMMLFDRYIPPCLEGMRNRFKKMIPITEMSQIALLCHLLACLLVSTNVPSECPKEWYDLYFAFACVWAFGSALFQDTAVDHRVEFSKWWVNEFKTVRFPTAGTVFDYYLDNDSKDFLPWQEKVPRFELDPDMPLQAMLVYSSESIRIRYFMDLLMENKHPVMLVGNSGVGKTILIADKLGSLSDQYAITNVAFNYYTSSEMLQKILEKPLEKKAGRNYGPPGNKTMVYFIDDMNMPQVDPYGTVEPHTLIRQHMDYGHWYDRNKLTLKEIHNCQYVASMNPTAGSFTINPRLQRHFCVFTVSFPNTETLNTIYSSILCQHFANPEHKFPLVVTKLCYNVVVSTMALHQKVTQLFLPTASKFHYIFNLRDISNIFQGLLFSATDCLSQPIDLIRLWMHETHRVYGDKLIDDKDVDAFTKVQMDIIKKNFDEVDECAVLEKPNIYCHFAHGIGEPRYMAMTDWSQLTNLLQEALLSYNDLISAMNLVLFEDAMMHVCRINRILESPRGSALLVGVGGSGKQSLSRLAAYISSLEVAQIQLRKGFGVTDLKMELSSLYMKSGLKNLGIMFLMTDAQVANEDFLVLINDMLASGEIPELFPDDEIDNIIAGVRNEVKGAGLPDTKENCWKFFIDRVRRQLKVVLCFSPVGSTLRVRARKFPALLNSSCINWFHEWPQQALISVSMNFLNKMDVLPDMYSSSVAQFMAHVHSQVNTMSKLYLQNERRYNYTTPKSFLEQIALYTKLLIQKSKDLTSKIDRLQNGLEKLKSTAKQVDDLKAKLAIQEVELKIKNEAADRLIEIVGVETEKVVTEKAMADAEERKVGIIADEVTKKQQDCEEDLRKAEPALQAAQDALNTLNKANLTELKSFGSPPGAVTNVTAGVMVLLAPNGKIPKDRSWKAAKVVMAKVDTFLDCLINYDKENIHPEVVKAIQPYLKDEEFEPEFIRSKSAAAAGLCAWVINIITFFEVYCDVEPKRKALEAANAELAAAQDKLAIIKAKVNSLEEQLSQLTRDFEQATAEKVKCQEEADATTRTISLANRLIGGLASENVRWAEAVASFMKQGTTLPGDVLLVTAFISYVGCFTKQYRQDLLHKMWLPVLKTIEPAVPITEGLDPLSLLTDDAQIAAWNNEGLPSDRMSTENATILSNTDRWPLMIDPQLQGLKWIKRKYGQKVTVLRVGQKGYMDLLENALRTGETVLMENIEESLDPVLDTLLGRNLIKKGKAIKIGDKEVEFHQDFRLILHTKLANPHYKPEMQAQTTLINFTVTRDGLEDQLLAEVVKAERPDLEQLKAELTKQQNDFKIQLKNLEDDLLSRLSSAGGNLLGDTALVENLETTKRTAAEIEVKVAEAKITSIQIDQAREHYRPAATRASLLYFILNELNTINPIYQFSLKAFSVVFHNAIERSVPSDEVAVRVGHLIDCITYSVFMYTTRGLFECDKLIFISQMTFQILLKSNEILPAELDFLLRFPITPHVTSPVDFLSNTSWGGVRSLSSRDEFRNLDRDIESSTKRWKKFVECECPEREKLPQEWKNKTPIQRLCMMRALRPDRMTYAIKAFIEEKLGAKYVEARSVDFAKSFEESSASTPIFFILSPGVNPLKDVEELGRKLGFTMDKGNFHNVSLGQGQEVVAEDAMEKAAVSGQWVVLQNVHLVRSWLPSLEKKLELLSIGAHVDFRIFMSAEPASTAAAHCIPQGILESSIKITNESPTGMQANIHKALDNFSQETLELCSKEAEFKAILFSLCYFHAVVAERRKFGPQGWNRVYPFNVGDLNISVSVLYNYLEANSKVPWEDLRYLFGEIMYGGHITDDWDRRLCITYLEEFMQPDLVDGELQLAPGFLAPPNLDYLGYHTYIDEAMPPESPYLYGLHPNAEIGFLTTTSEKLFRTVFEMQPRETSTAGGATVTREDKVKQIVDEIMEKLPEEFNMLEIMGKVEERTPYVIVAFQECQRMNSLTGEMKRSLKELDLGLKGELTITSDMEELEGAMFLDQVPAVWSQRAYPSLLGLTAWFADLLLRLRELETWSTDFVLPASVWLSGFFNPQSFLTAIMQSTARKSELPLDKMCLQCDVSKKHKEEFMSAPREGAYVHGLFMEGGRWDIQQGVIMESKLKELFPSMPVINIRAIPQDKQDMRNVYECPVYKTRTRGPTYVWTFNLKTKEKAAKWTLAGVALLLQI